MECLHYTLWARRNKLHGWPPCSRGEESIVPGIFVWHMCSEGNPPLWPCRSDVQSQHNETMISEKINALLFFMNSKYVIMMRQFPLGSWGPKLVFKLRLKYISAKKSVSKWSFWLWTFNGQMFYYKYFCSFAKICHETTTFVDLTVDNPLSVVNWWTDNDAPFA